MLELSFDLLMYHQYTNVLGEAAKVFKYEFPIRFDWLDTIDGGNLSLQCHPSPNYIQEHFGETFTQDETYYILEANPNASVYLGFQEGINKDQFKATLEHSFQTNTSVDIETYIQKHPAKKHDLFLIPHGTVHCSGEGSVVLEISATPYIFTFKMYDWLRLDLDGNPRPINIERAFENLDFTRQGKAVEQLISKSFSREVGEDWQILHLPTHPKHFYEIERLEFSTRITQRTQNQCHVLCLVEGTSITLETQHGMRQQFSYSETFVIPAAAESYILINEGQTTAKVIKAYVKSGVTL
jgi:mannose-6-phosphate isomerase class I